MSTTTPKKHIIAVFGGNDEALSERAEALGAKFGGRCVLGFQSISQVSSTYGKGAADTIVENCGNSLILRCSASEHGGTSQFASRLIGQREVVHTTRSEARRPSGGASTTMSEQPCHDGWGTGMTRNSAASPRRRSSPPRKHRARIAWRRSKSSAFIAINGVADQRGVLRNSSKLGRSECPSVAPLVQLLLQFTFSPGVFQETVKIDRVSLPTVSSNPAIHAGDCKGQTEEELT